MGVEEKRCVDVISHFFHGVINDGCAIGMGLVCCVKGDFARHDFAVVSVSRCESFGKNSS